MPFPSPARSQAQVNRTQQGREGAAARQRAAFPASPPRPNGRAGVRAAGPVRSFPQPTGSSARRTSANGRPR